MENNAERGFWDLTEDEKKALCPIPEPQRPGKDWRWWSLFLTSLAGAVGLFLFNVPGISIIQLQDGSLDLLRVFVITGAVLMMLGSDVGTLFTLLEIFRKAAAKTSSAWDWLGLIVSTIASISASTLSWSWQLDTFIQVQNVDITWMPIVKVWGPLAATLTIIVDLVASGAEAGLYLGSYDQRYKKWLEEEYIPWLRDMADGGAEGKIHKSAGNTSSAELPFYIKKVAGGYHARCPNSCGWQGSKLYDAAQHAKMAVTTHLRSCPEENGGDF